MSFEDIHKIIEILYSIPATQQLADVFGSQKHAEIELLKVKNELLSEDFEMSRIPSETSHLELFMSEKPKTKAAKSPLKSQPIHNNREKKSQPPTKTHQKPLQRLNITIDLPELEETPNIMIQDIKQDLNHLMKKMQVSRI